VHSSWAGQLIDTDARFFITFCYPSPTSKVEVKGADGKFWVARNADQTHIRELLMLTITLVLCGLVLLLTLLNMYQYLTQRAALRIAEILYVMTGNVRAKSQEVRRDGKDVEIIEAHLFDMATSARSILRALGRSEESLGPDPALTLTTNGSRLSSDSLLRLADNIFFSVAEDLPNASLEEIQSNALERFQRRVPNMEPEASRKIITVIAHQFQKDSSRKSSLAAQA
jgi:hypothetical protein